MLGFDLLGCGRIAKKHADILAGGQVASAKLVAVCDTNEAKARKFGEKYGVPWFVDMQKMMTDMGERIHVVCVLTESGNHCRHTIELARHYGQHREARGERLVHVDDVEVAPGHPPAHPGRRHRPALAGRG